MSNIKSLQQFNNLVGIKFQLYNSLFTSLPFHTIEKTGILVSMLLLACEEGYEQAFSPQQIIDTFFIKQTNYTKDEEKLDLLFRFVQYIERQIVLFDALEDAAFKEVNDMDGAGSLKQLSLSIEEQKKDAALHHKLKDFKVKLVLTAHPTQFYPDNVLGIINDLAKAIAKNNEKHIYSYLQQLGRTPFFNKYKPSPYDEAISLVWYLENVFYEAAGNIISELKASQPNSISANNSIINMGFWPGGDRDGNPFVTTAITVKVANALRAAIIKCYYNDVVKMKRRLTFKNIYTSLAILEEKLYKNIDAPQQTLDFSKDELLQTLDNIKLQLIQQHDSMFVYLIDDLMNKVEIFGLYFASLDIRQESTLHTKVIDSLNNQYQFLPLDYNNRMEADKMQALFSIKPLAVTETIEDAFSKETIESFSAIREIQKSNGEMGCHRYIISMCKTSLNVVEVWALFALAGWDTNNMSVDIVPLFETITDLQNAIEVMKQLYENPYYQKHLQQRGNTQTVMLGFSDGTKDGGYLMANWGIYKAKEQLTALSKQYQIEIVFFDGRGGPPARGGGKTHKFYASLGN